MKWMSAFTMIELMVVIAIMVALVGIGFGSLRGDDRSVRVKAEADRLAAVLQRARSMAMRNQASYGVTFNIQNEPGSSGAVLNNRSGGHWYRIIGPARNGLLSSAATGRIEEAGRIPWVGVLENFIGSGPANFPALLDMIRSSWASEPYILPARRVRFLAIADLDEGPRVHSQHPAGTTVFYGVSASKSYPRPWFGYFDASTQTLWPWGGYRADVPTSGFHYAGDNPDPAFPVPPPVVGCVNPTDRLVSVELRTDGILNNVDLNADGDVDDPFEREVDYPVLVAGQPRPLVNGNWLDACFIFLPNGQVRMQEWARNRRAFAIAVSAGSSTGGGVDDMTRYAATAAKGTTAATATRAYWGTKTWFANPLSGDHPYDRPPMVHFTEHTGGWFITLAPDVDRDQTSFASAREALRSMMPMYRVFISNGGTVQVVRVDEREGGLDGHTVWPTSSTVWDDVTATVANPIWQNCRAGYLHAVDSDPYNYLTTQLRPRGIPIVDQVNTRMLTQRIWWLDE
jgi:type II secretory pathway pseudopilin PulG